MHHRTIAVLIGLCAMRGALGAQQIPIRPVGAPQAVSKDTVSYLYGVRELSNGSVVANDAGARRLLLFDRTLAHATVIADSLSGSVSPYGKRAAGIIAYTADTTLLVDMGARAFVMFDAAGRVAGVTSPPRPNDVQGMTSPSLGQPRVDPRGRLLYRSTLPIAFVPPAAGKPFVFPELPDSAPLVRADFDTRSADTLAWLRIPKMKVSATPIDNGGMTMRALINPLSFIDDWTALPDGSIAVLRGRDYHIDWINADGSRSSSPKMPFDWRRLSDGDKAAIVDSTRRAVEKQFAAGNGASAISAAAGHGEAGPSGHSMTILRIDALDGGPAPKGTPSGAPSMGAPDVLPPGELPDYVPPVMRSGAMTADPQGNVWVLPSTSAQSGGGLLYDVIDRTGTVFQRVRIPAGRALVGFGAGGTVYLTYRDASGQHLERASLQ